MVKLGFSVAVVLEERCGSEMLQEEQLQPPAVSGCQGVGCYGNVTRVGQAGLPHCQYTGLVYRACIVCEFGLALETRRGRVEHRV